MIKKELQKNACIFSVKMSVSTLSEKNTSDTFRKVIFINCMSCIMNSHSLWLIYVYYTNV